MMKFTLVFLSFLNLEKVISHMHKKTTLNLTNDENDSAIMLACNRRYVKAEMKVTFPVKVKLLPKFNLGFVVNVYESNLRVKA